MKKLSTLAILISFTNILIAQTFVSTTPENKNVVLEEFTGIHCGYCPDGHLKGQQLHDANPGDVVLINIHSGSFAVPSAGEPDFRAPFGAAIDGQASVSGYPAGTVNRHLFSTTQAGGTAMSRGDWASAAGQIFAQPSCVNVAAEASLNISTRVLTVDVEAYYTGNSTSNTNKINVVLLQNNVEGPQSGMTANPTAILPNGNYNHQHMFRHLLTGQWGDDITSTTTGSVYQNTYSYTIPADLNGVAYDLFNLEVAVFVSEGQQEILSGNMADTMIHIVPPGVNLIDLSATTNMAMPTTLCDNSVTPEITVTNNCAIDVDTFEVSYTLNQNNPVSQTVYTALAAGANTTITFPSITVPSGENTISYSSGTLAGTSFIDNVPNNNLASSGSFNTISPTAFATSHTEGFEGYANMTPAPNNALLLNPQGYRVFIIDATWPGPNAGGFGNSHNSFRWQFAQMTGGNYADLVFAKIDFSASTGNGISYSYAHAQSAGFDNNRLQVLVSTDCGATWNLEKQLMGTALATTNPVAISSGNFYPTANDWATDYIDLSAYDGNAEVMISFKGICAGGNNLYIDDIDIRSMPSGVDENSTGQIAENKLVKITDMLGQETPFRRNTTLFYIYDDGTVDKKITIE